MRGRKTCLTQGSLRGLIRTLVVFKRKREKKEVFDAELEQVLFGIKDASISLFWLLRSSSKQLPDRRLSHTELPLPCVLLTSQLAWSVLVLWNK